MFFCSDSVSKATATIFFVVLTLFGGFFAVNLVLAVLEESFADQHGDEDEEAADAKALTLQHEVDESNAPSAQPASQEDHHRRNKSATAPTEVEIATHEIEAGEGGAAAEETTPNRFAEVIEGYEMTMFFTGLIIANTIVLALDRWPLSAEKQTEYDIINFVLAIAFFFEMVLKLAALGMRGYMESAFNVFDFVVVMLSIIELIVSPPAFLGMPTFVSGGGLSSLRTFRLFRIFKLAKSWKAMHLLLVLIVKTVRDITYFAFLLALFMYDHALCIDDRYFLVVKRPDPDATLHL